MERSSFRKFRRSSRSGPARKRWRRWADERDDEGDSKRACADPPVGFSPLRYQLYDLGPDRRARDFHRPRSSSDHGREGVDRFDPAPWRRLLSDHARFPGRSVRPKENRDSQPLDPAPSFGMGMAWSDLVV